MAEPRSVITTRPHRIAAAVPTGRIASRQSRGACRRAESTAAANTQSATLASSDGCSVKPPGQAEPALRAVALDARGEHE